MAFYTTKPIEIEAVRYDGNLDKIRAAYPDIQIRRLADNETRAEVWDYLQETWVIVRLGDYIIKGMKGEYYPCDPDIFEAKYEMVVRRDRGERTTTHER